MPGVPWPGTWLSLSGGHGCLQRWHRAEGIGEQERLSSPPEFPVHRVRKKLGRRWPWGEIMSPAPSPFSWRKPISILKEVQGKCMSSTGTLGPLICTATSQLTQSEVWGEISSPGSFCKQSFHMCHSARKEYRSLLLPGVKQGLSSNWQRSLPEWKRDSRIYPRKTSFWRKPWRNSKVQMKGKVFCSWRGVDASQLPVKEC